MQTVVETPNFVRKCKAAGLSEEEVAAILYVIAADPLCGELMVGTGGARKVRFARSGSGKSGGYRTIHYFGGLDVPVFMLDLVDKTAKANLSKAECNELAVILAGIADAYRKGSK